MSHIPLAVRHAAGQCLHRQRASLLGTAARASTTINNPCLLPASPFFGSMSRRPILIPSMQYYSSWHHSPFPASDIVNNINTCFPDCRSFSTTLTESSDTENTLASTTSRTPRRRRKSNPSSSSPPNNKSFTLTLTPEEYDPDQAVSQIHLASRWNQGRQLGQPNSNIRKDKERKWDYQFVRSAVDGYQNHLQYVLEHLDKEDDGSNNDTNINEQQHSIKKEKPNSSDPFHNIHPCPEKCANTHKLLSPQILARAVRALTRCKMDTPLLSKRIRDIERLVGKIGWTPITDDLSYRLLEANGKAGNVKRTLALLELRRTRGYAPREEERLDSTTASSFIQPGEKEFIHAITSIQSAQLPLRRSRNIYLHESSFSESSLDNPTRYLDAILINMSQRGVSLTPAMAARMLNCYASTGRTGRALHYFYKVVRDPVEEDGVYIPGPHPTHLGKEEMEMWKAEKRGEGVGRALSVALEVSQEKEDKELDVMVSDANNGGMPENGNIKNKVRMIMHSAPPFHKIPGLVKGAPLIQNRDHMPFSFEGASSKAAASSPTTDKSSSSSSVNTTKPQGAVNPYDRKAKSMTKFEWEMERDWSLSLTAAFAFADSLTHGACGHQPIELNLGGWNALIKACCYRGAFHRALKILNETMPQKGIEPDSFSYNTILAGLARVGDIASLKEYLIGMTNKQVLVDKFTVQAMADGFLNTGDISGASTMVQDIFNQHDTLPPYTTHLKIIEFALSNGLIFEAKRHVYFIQQLWKWQPSQHHDKKFCQIVNATKRNPKLSKEALQKLFRYFGEELTEEEFF